MRFSRGLVPLMAQAGLCAADVAPEPQHIFSNPPAAAPASLRIPTRYESAVQGRRILALTPLAMLATVFPDDKDDAVSGQENRPAGLGGMPIGLMDYIADCESAGNPTILAIGIATSFKNVAAGSNISVSVQWTPPYPPEKRIRSTAASASATWLGRLLGLGRGGDHHRHHGHGHGHGHDGKRRDPVPFSAANLPRFSLLGYLEPIEADAASAAAVSSCFVDAHPDAKYWLPGNSIHASEFVRLVVREVYWIGGFGDRAYIGWLSPDDWKNVTRAEWEAVRLPGEKKGWKEWSASSWSDL